MTKTVRLSVLLVSVFLACGVSAEELKGAQQREFPVSIPAARAALQNMGAYTGARLPSLEGFTKEQALGEHYQRPYYEYKIELEPVTPSRTRVRVKANVSVWYDGPDGPPGYQGLQSNGRLETDLLDRLGDFLKDKSDDPKVLAQTIAELKTQRAQAEDEISNLQRKLKSLQDGTGVGTGTEYASIKRSAPVLSAPATNAKILVRARAEDEFPITGHRGEWVEIGLGNGQTGWLRRSEVATDAAMPVSAQAAPRTGVPGFTIIREQTTEFSGDWARLRDKKALYVWARPDGSLLNVGTGDRLTFVQRIFTDRYREIAHGASDSVDGVVVIFLDERGGVAAATMEDIRLWVEGTISSSNFLRKCSLDPPSAFHDRSTTTPAKAKQGSVSYRAAGMKSPRS